MSIKLMSLIWEKDIPTAPKIILLALADSANDEGVCWPSIKTLIKKTNLGRSTILQYLNIFETDGLLKKNTRCHENGRQRSSNYALNRKKIEELIKYGAIQNKQKKKQSVQLMDGEGPAAGRGRVQLMDPSKENPNIEPKKTNKNSDPELYAQKKPKPKRTKSNVAHAPLEFEKLWEIYPGKGSKKSAEKVWSKLKPSDELIEEMRGAINNQIAWRKGEGFYPNWKHFERWLKNECWKDPQYFSGQKNDDNYSRINPNDPGDLSGFF